MQRAIRDSRGLWSGSYVSLRNGEVLETLCPDDGGINTSFWKVCENELAIQSLCKLFSKGGNGKSAAGEFYTGCPRADGVLTVASEVPIEQAGETVIFVAIYAFRFRLTLLLLNAGYTPASRISNCQELFTQYCSNGDVVKAWHRGPVFYTGGFH